MTIEILKCKSEGIYDNENKYTNKQWLLTLAGWAHTRP